MRQIVFCLFILHSYPALGQAPQEQEVSLDVLQKSVAQFPGHQLKVRESRLNRSKTNYTLTGGMGVTYMLPTYTYQFGMRKGADHEFGVRLLKTRVFLHGWYDGPKSPPSMYTFGGYYKRYFGNSFFISSGAGYRTYKTYYYHSVRSGNWLTGGWRKEDIYYRDLAASVDIGNQWQWENFTLGVSWIGLSRNLVALSDEAPTKDHRRVLTGFHFNVLNLNLGVSF